MGWSLGRGPLELGDSQQRCNLDPSPPVHKVAHWPFGIHEARAALDHQRYRQVTGDRRQGEVRFVFSCEGVRNSASKTSSAVETVCLVRDLFRSRYLPRYIRIRSPSLVVLGCQEIDWPRRIQSRDAPAGLHPQQNVGSPEQGPGGRPGRPGRRCASAGLELEGPISVAQPPNPIRYPPSPSQPSQPTPLAVLAHPQAPTRTSFPSVPLSFSARLPVASAQFCAAQVPVPALQPQQNSQSPSELTTSFPDFPLPHPQNSILSGGLYTHTHPLSHHTQHNPTTQHRRPRRPQGPLADRLPPDKAKLAYTTAQPCARRDRPLGPRLACPRQVQSNPPGPLITA